jgi:uncharacterized protein (TIGR03382 family)
MDFVEPDVAVVWLERSPGGVNFGWAVSGLEDIDGDGADDAITCDTYAAGSDGQVVVLSGADGSTLHTFAGASGSLLGYAVADAGDVDGDGVHDVIAGAPGAGMAFVWSGADGSEILVLEGDPPVDGIGSGFGAAVAGPGDVDGDGRADLLVGAVNAQRSGPQSGVASLWSADGELLLEVVGEEAGDHLGTGVGAIGDVDGDGVPDLVVGARDAGPLDGGQVIVASGEDGHVLFAVQSDDAVDLGVYFVAGVGDIDGDAIPDVFGGDFSGDAGRGTATVWSGADGSRIHAFAGDTPTSGMGTGRGAGDVDGDGVPDLAIGSWTSNDGAPGAGKIDVFSGADGSILRTITSSRAGENLGFDVVGLGDVDGDGAVDLLASGATLNRVYVLGWPVEEAEPDPTTGTDAPSASCGCSASHGVHAPWAAALALAWAWLGRRRASATRSRDRAGSVGSGHRC